MPQLSEGLWPDSLSSGEFPEAQGRVEAHRTWLSARRVCRSADFGAERPSVALLAELLHRQGLFQVQPAQQLLDVFGEDVALQIDARAGAVSAKRRMAERVWDDRRTQHAAFDRCHGQADAIDGDGALVHQVSVELVGDANAQPPVVIAEGIQAKELARAVHMALHDMAVHRSEERRVGKECRSRWSPYH